MKLSREMVIVLACATVFLMVPSVCAVLSVEFVTSAYDVETQDLAKGEDPPPIVTLAEFDRTELGMSYQGVVDILGAPGVMIVPPPAPEGEHGGVGMTQYVWQNSDFSNMRATFQDDQLAKKSQLYLR